MQSYNEVFSQKTRDLDAIIYDEESQENQKAKAEGRKTTLLQLFMEPKESLENAIPLLPAGPI